MSRGVKAYKISTFVDYMDAVLRFVKGVKAYKISTIVDRSSDPADVPCPTHPCPADAPCRTVGLDLQSRPIEYKDFQSATTTYCAKMARVVIKSKPFHHAFGGFVLFVLCRVPFGTLV